MQSSEQNKKVFFVDYKYGTDRWEPLSPFSDFDTANAYMKQQVKQSQGGVNGSLNGLDPDDFRIRTMYL